MLMPKRVKRRKQFRGTMAGKALRGNKITNGQYGLVATEPAWIKSNQIEAARYGRITDEIRTAWKMMLKSIYSSEVGYQEGPPENILCARPALELKSVSSWGRLAKKYDRDLYKKAAFLFAKAMPESPVTC